MDNIAVDKYFEIIKKYLGDLKSFKPSDTFPNLLDFGVSKGDIRFWQVNNKYVKYKYKVEFEKKNDVWIDLYFFPYSNKVYLSKFVVSLKENDKVTLEKMTMELVEFINKLSEPLQN